METTNHINMTANSNLSTKQSTDMIAQSTETKDTIDNILHKFQQQSSIDCYMTHPKMCTCNSSEEFNSLLLSIEKVTKLTVNDYN